MEEQQFVLRWHYHDSTLVNSLPCFLENDIFTDVIISVGTQQLKAHKIILAMCSAYFFQLFQEINTQLPVIVLHNVSAEDVKAILAFIYKGQCVVTQEHLPSLLSVAKLLKIQGLCDMKVPEKQVQDNQTPANDNDQFLNNYRNEKVNICNSICENNNTAKKQVQESIKNKTNSLDKALNLKKHNQLWDKPTSEYVEEQISPILKKSPNSKDSSETCKCFLCGKYLSNQYNLRVHMETHEEAFHACQSCPHVSRSRDALRKHVSYRHPEEYHTRKRKKTEQL